MFLLHNALPDHDERFYNYASNCNPRTFPHGFDMEIFTNTVLQQAHREATTEYEQEHVTPWIIRQAKAKQPLRLVCPMDYSHLRCTVDYPQDFDVVSHVLQSLRPGFTWRDVAALLTERLQCSPGPRFDEYQPRPTAEDRQRVQNLGFDPWQA
jgi:spore coat polysaccharide biosynthesis protein SpsF (cytidylyltransferase family)